MEEQDQITQDQQSPSADQPRQICSFKLISGEEIIAVLKGMEGGNLILEKARLIAIHQDSMGRMGIGIMPWMHSNPDSVVVIEAGHVISMVEPIQGIQQAYLERTSGLAIASHVPPPTPDKQGSSILLG